MSVHSELQNILKNKSGTTAISIHSRSGDSEDGDTLFDLMPNGEPSAFDIVTRNEQANARKQFLVKYFTLLKERLNRFEFEYIKQLYVEGQAERVICDNLGLNLKKFKRGLMRKLSASKKDISELVAASDWDDAELFSQCFLSAPQDIQDVNELQYLPKTVKGFGNLIERLAYRRYRKIYKHEWYKRRDYNAAGYCIGRIYLTREIAELIRSAGQITRVMSFDFLCQAAKCYGLKIDREELAGFELFYNNYYDIMCEITQKLYDFSRGRDITQEALKREQEKAQQREQSNA